MPLIDSFLKLLFLFIFANLTKWCPCQESNLELEFRKLLFYPLDYRDKHTQNIILFQRFKASPESVRIAKMKTTYNWKLIIGIGVGVLVLLAIIISFINGNGDIVTEKAFKGSLIRTIDVTGKVVPTDEVDLAFTSSGKINSIRVKEGDKVFRGQVLASLDASEISASLRQALADKDVAQAELGAIVGTSGISGKEDSVKREALSVAQKALNTSITQVKTNTDSLFENPQSGRPEITTAIKDYFERLAIGQKRVEIGKLLTDWNGESYRLNVSNISQSDLEEVLNNLNQISSYFTQIANALSEAETTSSITEATLSEYRATVTSARSAVDSVISEVVDVKEKLRNVKSDVPVQEAKIVAASANIDKYQAQINDFTIVAPFDGVVVDVPAVSGEIVSSNQNIVSLISDSTVEVEVFIPEVHVKDLTVNDPAKISFDAFGDELILGATVVYIEGRGVVRDGIVTYKTRLQFASVPSDVRAGMTASIEIDALVVENVLMIPRAAVKISDEVMTDPNTKKATVKVVDGGDYVEKEITIGRSDSSGHVEVVSGLNEGEEVIVSELE